MCERIYIYIYIVYYNCKECIMLVIAFIDLSLNKHRVTLGSARGVMVIVI